MPSAVWFATGSRRDRAGDPDKDCRCWARAGSRLRPRVVKVGFTARTLGRGIATDSVAPTLVSTTCEASHASPPGLASRRVGRRACAVSRRLTMPSKIRMIDIALTRSDCAIHSPGPFTRDGTTARRRPTLAAAHDKRCNSWCPLGARAARSRCSDKLGCAACRPTGRGDCTPSQHHGTTTFWPARPERRPRSHSPTTCCWLRDGGDGKGFRGAKYRRAAAFFTHLQGLFACSPPILLLSTM